MSNDTITRLFGIVDDLKHQTGGQMTLNDVMLGIHAVICFSIYH